VSRCEKRFSPSGESFLRHVSAKQSERHVPKKSFGALTAKKIELWFRLFFVRLINRFQRFHYVLCDVFFETIQQILIFVAGILLLEN